MSDYVPGTEETDPKKIIMSLQQMARTNSANSDDIAALQASLSAATTTTAGIVELATAAEMVTGTDTGRVPSVSVVQNHPGVAKGWALVQADGTLTVGYNITSAKDSTGIYTITLGTDMGSANYVALATAQSGGMLTSVNTFAAGSFKVETRTYLNVNQDSVFHVAVFGDQ